MKPKKVSTNKVVLSLPESKVFIHNFNLSTDIKGNELRKAVLSEVSKLIPVDKKGIYWDFQSYPSLEKDKQSIVFASVEKSIAEDYIKLCNMIGLEVVSLEVESMSLGRVLLSKTEEVTLIVDIGAETTNISVFNKKDIINLSVVSPFAGDKFTEMISKDLSIDFQEAEKEKIKDGIELKDESSGDTSSVFRRMGVASVLRTEFDEIILEINKAVSYYERNTGQKIEKIVLVGGSSLLPGINEYFSSKIKIPIEERNLFSYIKKTSLLGEGKRPVLFANVMGLAMIGASNEFHSINLLKQIPRSFVVSPSKIDLVKLGYLRRTTKLTLLLNSRIMFLFLLIIIVIVTFVFAHYFNHYFNPYSNQYINFVSNLFKKGV